MYSESIDLGKVMFVFLVDDIIVAASNEQLLNNVKMLLSSKFKLKELGKLRWFLAIAFLRHDGCTIFSWK